MTSGAEDRLSGSLARVSSVPTPRAAALVALLLLIAAAGVAGLTIATSHRSAIERAETRAESAAHVVATNAQWLVEASHQALRRVDDALGVWPDTADTAVPGTPGALDQAVAALPGQVVVWVFDANGDSVLSNDPLTASINVADREYFQALRAGSEWHIARLLTSRAGPVKAFGIGRRIERDGQFRGVAIIAVRAELMAEFWLSLDLGPDSSVALIRDDGWLVARFPVPEDTMDLSGHALFTRYLPRAPAGHYSSEISPADGVARIVGYRRVPNAPLIAVAGISRDAALAGFWSRIGLGAALVAPVLLILLAAAFWLSHLLRRDETSRSELRSALAENRFLLREIHHRVKNNLQTISSLAQLQPGAPEAKEAMTRRLSAMSAVHEHIYSADQFAVLNLAEYLSGLIASLEQSYGASIRVEQRLVTLEIDADRAQALGLILSEVVSNAFKHAFPDGRAGRIMVDLDRIDDATARLRVRDTGVGVDIDDVQVPSGMGSRLVAGFAERLGGEYSFTATDGTLFELVFPLDPGRQPSPITRPATPSPTPAQTSAHAPPPPADVAPPP